MGDVAIKCPSCGSTIPLSDALTGEVRLSLEQEFERKLAVDSDSLKAALEEGFRRDADRMKAEASAALRLAGESSLTQIRALEQRLSEEGERRNAEIAERIDAERAEIRKQESEAARLEVEKLGEANERNARTVLALQDQLASKERSQEAELSRRLEVARAQIREQEAKSAREEIDTLKRDAVSQSLQAQTQRAEFEQKQRRVQAEHTAQIESARRQGRDDASRGKDAELQQVRAQSKDQAAQIRTLSGHLEAERTKAEIELKRQLREQRRAVEADIEQKLAEEHRSRELLTLRQLHNAQSQIDELKRKLETSSRQLEGDVVEADLLSLLKEAFPSDDVRSISKRGGGADVLQRVRIDGRSVGSIVWESKNTTLWQNSWLEKLRQDQRKESADVAVLVTAVRPKNCGRLELRESIWVTERPLAVGVAAMLRSSLGQLAQYRDVPLDAAERYAGIQKYLGSTEFRHRIEAVVEAFTKMRDDLSAERRAMEKHWAQREKGLRLVIDNIAGMYGELREVAGPTLARVRRLELPAGDGDSGSD